MNLKDKLLYHQIHPAKLATDSGVAIPACYLFWRHQIVAAISGSLLPPIIISAVILVADINLEPYKNSSFGRYLNTYMTRTVEAVRLIGFVLMAIGSWFHQGWLLVTGIVVVLLGWLRGLIWSNANKQV